MPPGPLPSAGPLAGLKLLDFSAVLSGPLTAATLALVPFAAAAALRVNLR